MLLKGVRFHAVEKVIQNDLGLVRRQRFDDARDHGRGTNVIEIREFDQSLWCVATIICDRVAGLDDGADEFIIGIQAGSILGFQGDPDLKQHEGCCDLISSIGVFTEPLPPVNHPSFAVKREQGCGSCQVHLLEAAPLACFAERCVEPVDSLRDLVAIDQHDDRQQDVELSSFRQFLDDLVDVGHRGLIAQPGQEQPCGCGNLLVGRVDHRLNVLGVHRFVQPSKIGQQGQPIGFLEPLPFRQLADLRGAESLFIHGNGEDLVACFGLDLRHEPRHDMVVFG